MAVTVDEAKLRPELFLTEEGEIILELLIVVWIPKAALDKV
jgi:hypothetical protein